MKVIGKPIPKKDAMSVLTGKPVYCDDLAPKNCLIGLCQANCVSSF
ncbi:MAG: hypothetical protein PUH10_06450 [Erysipelotrichaceae bacterium]|nr:hypothetical protein [Floccifex sp.]MDD7281612.1 hypothetical protein [Erysipelotrichaceae bacterium]MDY2958388.1 hypothetical protein [Floccifex sp.]